MLLSVRHRERFYKPLRSCQDDLTLVCDGEVYNYYEIRRNLAEHKFKTDSSNEAILHLIEENNPKNLLEAVKISLSNIDGIYSFAITKGDETVIARDPLGVKPMYIGENNDFFAAASERKALWGIGIKEVRSFSPGHAAHIVGRKCKIFKANILRRPHIRKINAKTAALTLQKALYSAFEKRIKSIDKIGIAFSGGIDSSIAAKIVSDLGGNATLYTAGLEGSSDIMAAREASSFLGCELFTKILTINDLEKYIPKVVYAVETADEVKVSAGLPLYAAAESASSNGVKTMISGQGSDELFGGYARYLKILKQGGYRDLQNNLWRDLTRLYEVILQRDDAVVMANGIGLSLPYLDINVIKTALAIPPSLKINATEDELRKRILRAVAKEMGLPTEIAARPKKAIHYGSGVDKAMRTLARKLGHSSVRSYLESVYAKVFKNLADFATGKPNYMTIP